MKPLIKWAGGKRHIASVIEEHLPANWDHGTYFEPFLGGAAIFLHLQPKKASLSDVNARLISFYHHVKLDNDSLIAQIGKISKKFDSTVTSEKLSMYLELRQKFNSSTTTTIQTSALFFALNQLCFNGLYRENARGSFNVPFGKKEKFPPPDLVAFEQASSVFGGAKIHVSDFETALRPAKSGDFVYLDPPYIPKDATSNFTAYSSGGFGLDAQHRLAALMSELTKKGVRVMLSNSSTPLTKEIYKGFRAVEIKAPRMLSARATGRGQISELLVMNY